MADAQRQPAAPPRSLPARRPAETSGVAGAVALLVARLLGFVDDADAVVALAMVLGALPAVVTWIEDRRRGALP